MILDILTLVRGKKVHIEVCALDDWGQCDCEERVLYIRNSLGEKNQVRTLIHECVHFLHPELSEEAVLLIERDIYKSLTRAQYRELRKRLR